MTIIKKVSEMIQEELEDACNYAKCALKYKDDYPSLAKAFYQLSTEESEHARILHGEVVKLIESYRRDNGEPPEAMQAVYDYLHEQQIEKANKARMYQEQFKNY